MAPVSFLAAASLAIPFAAFAQPPPPFNVIGYGAESCSAWTEARRAQNARYFGFVGWMQGYMTAFNEWGDTGKRKDVLGKYKFEEAELAVTRVCLRQPTAELEDVVGIIVHRLFVRQTNEETERAIEEANPCGKPR